MTYSMIRAAAGTLVIPLFALTGVAAQAQAPTAAPVSMPADFRIGFADPDRVLREAEPARTAQARLTSEFVARQDAVTAQGKALKAASDQFERDAPTLSEDQRSQRQRQLVEQDREFQRARTTLEEDINARKNQELAQLSERVNQAVKQVAEAEHYDAIVQEAIYINPKHDITDRVIKYLNNAGAAGSAATGAAPRK